MILPPELYALRSAFRDYAALAPDIASFCGEALMADHGEVELEAARLPACDALGVVEGSVSPATQALVSAVVRAAPQLQWRQSYTEDDPGIDANYLANYAWFNLIAPSGPFVSDRLRLSVGYWGAGLVYPRHWHAPEEIYLTLAGRVLYRTDGRADLEGGPGATVAHASNHPHAAVFKTAALVAAFWRGDALEGKSSFGE